MKKQYLIRTNTIQPTVGLLTLSSVYRHQKIGELSQDWLPTFLPILTRLTLSAIRDNKIQHTASSARPSSISRLAMSSDDNSSCSSHSCDSASDSGVSSGSDRSCTIDQGDDDSNSEKSEHSEHLVRIVPSSHVATSCPFHWQWPRQLCHNTYVTGGLCYGLQPYY